MTGAKNDAARDYNRQCWGTSNGVIATCGTTSSSATVTLLGATAAQLRQLSGKRVDIGTIANPTSVASARTVDSVSTANGTITISGATVSTTSGAAFVFNSGAGGDTANSTQKEITGLQTIVDSTGTLFNVDPSTYSVWASYEDSNSGTLRAPSDSLFEKALDEVFIASGEEPDVIITTNGIHRSYANSLKSQKRFANTIDLKGGFKAIEVSAGQAFLLNTKHITDYIQADWQFMDDDGAVLSRVPDTDAYEATLFKDSEQATSRRNAHGKILDLSGD